MRPTILAAVGQIVLALLCVVGLLYALTVPDHVCDPRVIQCE